MRQECAFSIEFLNIVASFSVSAGGLTLLPRTSLHIRRIKIHSQLIFGGRREDGQVKNISYKVNNTSHATNSQIQVENVRNRCAQW